MTGASGYIGSVVGEQAIQQGYNVYALSRTETSDEKIRTLGATPVSSNAVTARELATAIAHTANLPLESLSFDKVTSRMGEFMARFLSVENRASGKKARETLGWEPQGPTVLDDIKSGSYSKR